MTPSAALQLQIATLLAHDATTLANMTALNVHLAASAFTPSPALDPTTITEATYPGYAALSPVAGNQDLYYDPVTGLLTIQLKEPSGGWHFQTTGTPSPAQTIFGWWVTDNTNAVLYGSGLLASPITLNASGQGFNLPTLTFGFPNNSPV